MLHQRKRLKEYGTFLKVDVIEQHTFNTYDISHYIQLFKKLNKQGMLSADSFHDDVWFFKRKRDGSTHTLNFDFEIYSSLVRALKCYVLIKISSGINTVHQGLRYLKEVCISSCGFQMNHISDMEEVLIRANHVYGKIKIHSSAI